MFCLLIQPQGTKMPVCKKCKESFPNRIKLDGKIHYLNSRSYCLNCSPWKENAGYLIRKQNTRELQNLSEEAKKTCPICSNEFKWTKNNVCSTCRAAYSRYKNKIYAIELLGGKCKNCNCDDIRCLEFHHLDPSTKDVDISYLLNCSKKRITAEVEKCILLCANCHAIEHSQDKQDIIDYYEK